VSIPVPGAADSLAGLARRLDGIAGLIQAHKLMGQPICTTPISGAEVTVQFESEN
jgi:hypothetical protein